MIRNGRAQYILQRCFCASEKSILKYPHRNLLSLRYYATSDGKKGKGGGPKNPVIQGYKKPVSMKECVMPPECPVCPEDPEKNRKRYIRNMVLTVVLFALLAFGMYKYFEEDEIVPMEQPTTKSRKKRRKRGACKDPVSSSDLPKKVPYLLIGGGTAAFSAFRSIKSMDPTAQVLLISSEFEFPYMRPPLSKEMWFNDNQDQMEKLQFKQWNGTVRSIYYEPKEFYNDPASLTSLSKGGIAVARGWTVKKIDPYNRKATLDDDSTITYDKCLIATGSIPKTLPAFERASEGVKELIQTYRDVFDFQDLNDIVQDNNSIAVVGGGFLGSELACALARHGQKKGLKVYQIFKEPGNMGKVLPEYLSVWTTKKVEAEGVEVMPETQVIDATVGENRLKLSLSNGKKILVDHCIVAVGAKPDTRIAEVSELEIDPDDGGIRVNAELQARSNLWVAGDAASFYDLKLGRRRIEHHDHAVVSGRLAGENMAGAGKPYWHQSMFWSDLGPEVGYEAIGIIDSKLPTVGVFAKKTEKDSPGAVVAATDSSIRSQTEESAAPIPPAQGSPTPPKPGEDFGKGVIFYLRDDIVVGIVMWNVFNRMQIARQVLKDERKYDDLNEVAKLFNIHEE